MKRVLAFFVRYPIWANVLMFTIVGFGIISWSQMKYSFFPEIPPDYINVEVEYIGASPEEVEEGVVLKIEENLEGIEGVDRVTSVSRENFGTVIVEVLRGKDIDKVLQDVKNAVDKIGSFPKGSEKPVVYERKYRSHAMSVVLYGDTDLFNLKYVAEQIRDDFLDSPEMSQVNIGGLPNIEFSIEVTEEDMRRYEMTFDEISAAVAAANINISGGKLETKDEEVLIRTWGRKYFAKQLHSIVVRGTADGTIVYLRDIANIKEKWEDVPNRVSFNGKGAVILKIEKTGHEDILAIAEKVKTYVKEFNQKNSVIHASILDDRTIPLLQRINLLMRNGILGLILVLLLLSFFLNLRFSFWVSVGLPFSFAGMFILIAFVGITINVISLFGMIIVVGILVDDAIVVGENIFAHYERGKPPLNAAIDGAFEMLPPVFTSVFTTIVAFTPFFFLDGVMGKFIWHMALVVISALLFSLVEAFFILPAHLAHSKGLQSHQKDSKIRKKIERFIHTLTHKIYAPLLRSAMNHKWITVVAPTAFVLLTIGLVRGGFIGLTFFPIIDGDTLPVNLTLVAGSQEKDVDEILAKIEKACWQVNEEMKKERPDKKDLILGIKRVIGSNDLKEQGSHVGKLKLQLLDGEARMMDTEIISNRIRDVVGPIPEAQNITFGRVSMFGKPVSISLLGTEPDQLRKARDLLVAELKEFDALKDVVDTEQEGRREIDIRLKPRADAMGLKLQDVIGQVRQGFFGQQIQRIQRGRDEIRVWVRYSDKDRASLTLLDQMRIRTPQGEYPFSELAYYKVRRGVTRINHLNRRREITVEASLSSEDVDLPPILNEIQTEVVPKILSKVNNVQALFEGQSREQKKITTSVITVFPIAMVVMFIMIVLVFRSVAQAGLVITLIPLGIMGAIWGHGIRGIQLNMLSLYGIIALTGIVVNDSIVLVDQVNRNLRLGQKFFDAVYNAGISRLRPILLTTLTTSIGLAPILIEKSRQAQFLIPMAVSVAFGLLFGTFILLLILPAGLLVLNRVRMVWAGFFTSELLTPESVEPAVKELKEAVVEL